MKQEEKEVKEEDKDLCEYLLNLMENYSDSVIPSFSELNPETETGEETPDEYHPLFCTTSRTKRPRVEASSSLAMERKRRSTIKQSFSVLQSMVPNLPIKTTRSNVLAEAIAYIEELKGVVKELEEKKMRATNGVKRAEIALYGEQQSSINVVVSGKMAFFGVRFECSKGLVTKVLMVFEKNGAEVLSANSFVNVNGGVIQLSVTVIVHGGAEVVEEIKRDIVCLLCSSC